MSELSRCEGSHGSYGRDGRGSVKPCGTAFGAEEMRTSCAKPNCCSLRKPDPEAIDFASLRTKERRGNRVRDGAGHLLGAESHSLTLPPQ